MEHTPVLLQEVIRLLNPHQGGIFIDATINGGGHMRAIGEKIEWKGKFLGIDLDGDLIERLARERQKNLSVVCANYADIAEIALQNNMRAANGIIADLGFSSYHIEESGRGFSFLRDEPLDMRYSARANTLTAEKILAEWSEEDIERILRECGEERFSRRIARVIVQERRRRPIARTSTLVALVLAAIPAPLRRRKPHAATRTFQAIRIAVNRELENLEKFLQKAPLLLMPQAVLAVISFHSLEDRMVKRRFSALVHEGNYTLLNKKPLVPSRDEIAANPRARSAKLRALLRNA